MELWRNKTEREIDKQKIQTDNQKKPVHLKILSRCFGFTYYNTVRLSYKTSKDFKKMVFHIIFDGIKKALHPPLDIIQCLKQIKLQRLMLTCIN